MLVLTSKLATAQQQQIVTAAVAAVIYVVDAKLTPATTVGTHARALRRANRMPGSYDIFLHNHKRQRENRHNFSNATSVYLLLLVPIPRKRCVHPSAMHFGDSTAITRTSTSPHSALTSS